MRKDLLSICILIGVTIIIGCKLEIGREVYAVGMNSGEFKIENSVIDVSPLEESSTGYSINQGWGQLADREFQRQGYVVRVSFGDSPLTKALNLSVSRTNVLFEDLKENKPVTQEITLRAVTEGIPYKISTIGEGPLTSKNGAIVENTKCDQAETICLDGRAQIWLSNSSYGFGYSLLKPLYRPFPDTHFGDKPAFVFSSDGVNSNELVHLWLKANVSKNQEGNNYQTVVNFIFTPSF